MKKILIVLFFIFYSSFSFAYDIKAYDLYFIKYSRLYFGDRINWKWFKAQGIAESALRAEATSWVGASGIMQIMPRTWREISEKTGIDINDIFAPEYNIMAGIFYDRHLWKQWTAERPDIERLLFVFGSYNGGIGNILKAQKECSKESDFNLNCNLWYNVTHYANQIETWKYEETLNYVERIKEIKDKL